MLWPLNDLIQAFAPSLWLFDLPNKGNQSRKLSAKYCQHLELEALIVVVSPYPLNRNNAGGGNAGDGVCMYVFPIWFPEILILKRSPLPLFCCQLLSTVGLFPSGPQILYSPPQTTKDHSKVVSDSCLFEVIWLSQMETLCHYVCEELWLPLTSF